MSWGPRHRGWFSHEVVTRSPDMELDRYVHHSIHQPIQLRIELFGACQRIELNRTVLRFASERPEIYAVTFSLPPQKLQPIEQISVKMGC